MVAVTYDREADVLYLDLAGDGPETQGEEVHPGVMLLFDGAGRIVGLEITSASKVLAPEAIAGAIGVRGVG
jgi:uncharacterized protein YuzE